MAPGMDWLMEPLVAGKFRITVSLLLLRLRVSITAALLGSPRCPPHLLVSDTRREIFYRGEELKLAQTTLSLLFPPLPFLSLFHFPFTVESAFIPLQTPPQTIHHPATQLLSCHSKHDSFGRNDRSRLWRVRQMNMCGSDLDANTFILTLPPPPNAKVLTFGDPSLSPGTHKFFMGPSGGRHTCCFFQLFHSLNCYRMMKKQQDQDIFRI